MDDSKDKPADANDQADLPQQSATREEGGKEAAVQEAAGQEAAVQETGGETPDDVKAIVERLRAPAGELPDDAIRAAHQHAREITPHLISLINEATALYSAGADSPDAGYFFATYLLADFRAEEAWPAIREVVRLPAETLYEMYGASVSEDFGFIIEALVGERIEEIYQLIDDPSIDMDVRWQGIDALVRRLARGMITREEITARLTDSLKRALETEDSLVEPLVMDLTSLAAKEAMPLIDEAIERGMVGATWVPPDWVEEQMAGDEETVNSTLSSVREIGDLADYFISWGTFDNFLAEDDEEDDEWDEPFVETLHGPSLLEPSLTESPLFMDDDDDIETNNLTIRNDSPHIGRNEKCPCGSGRKYKKCCGNRSANSF